MILLDSCVLFDHMRGKDPKLAALLAGLPVAVCGVTRAETLCGAKDPKHRASLEAELNSFAQVPTPDSVWDAVGDNLAILRSNGVTIPFADAMLATLAILNDLELWTRDAHFTLAQKWLPTLKLFQEPP